MKKFLFLTIYLPAAFAGEPYIEYKNASAFIDREYLDQVNYLRPGYKWDNNLYVEAGPMYLDDDWGTGAEAGYKFKLDKITLKGKWEGAQYHGDLKHKLETEIRYTW